MSRFITRVLVAIAITAFTKQTIAQSSDTLAIAKQLMAKESYKRSVKLLDPFYTNHPGSLNAQWLYGQSLYFSGRYKKFQAVYEDGIAWHPENYYLRLDYAKKLVAAGYTGKAYPILELYLKYDSTAPDVHAALAQLDYWNADYSKATNEINKVLVKDPSNKEVKTIRGSIIKETSPWIRLQATYNSDDQPFSVFTPGVEAGMYSKKAGFLNLSYQALIFKRDSATFPAHIFKLGTSFHFNKGNDLFSLHAGFIDLPDHTIKILADIEYNKKIDQNFSVDLKAEHLPYLSTRNNIENPVMFLHYNLSASWINRHHWEGKIYGDLNQFYSDSNNVFTVGGWIYTPPVSFSIVKCRIGYAFSYADAQRNQFAPKQKGSAAVSEWVSTGQVDGYYDLFFTPQSQTIHSVLASVIIKAGNKNEVGLKANVGVSAHTQSPYFVLLNDAGNDASFEKQYFNRSFNPYDLNIYWLYTISSSAAIKAEYKYLVTNFYTSNYAGIALTLNFLNERH